MSLRPASQRAPATTGLRSEERGTRNEERANERRGKEPPQKAPGGERALMKSLDEGFLDGAEPGVDLERAPLRVVRLEPAPLLLELLGHAEPDAEREPDVVQRLEPRQGLILGQLDAAALL